MPINYEVMKKHDQDVARLNTIIQFLKNSNLTSLKGLNESQPSQMIELQMLMNDGIAQINNLNAKNKETSAFPSEDDVLLTSSIINRIENLVAYKQLVANIDNNQKHFGTIDENAWSQAQQKPLSDTLTPSSSTNQSTLFPLTSDESSFDKDIENMRNQHAKINTMQLIAPMKTLTDLKDNRVEFNTAYPKYKSDFNIINQKLTIAITSTAAKKKPPFADEIKKKLEELKQIAPENLLNEQIALLEQELDKRKTSNLYIQDNYNQKKSIETNIAQLKYELGTYGPNVSKGSAVSKAVSKGAESIVHVEQNLEVTSVGSIANQSVPKSIGSSSIVPTASAAAEETPVGTNQSTPTPSVHFKSKEEALKVFETSNLNTTIMKLTEQYKEINDIIEGIKYFISELKEPDLSKERAEYLTRNLTEKNSEFDTTYKNYQIDYDFINKKLINQNTITTTATEINPFYMIINSKLTELEKLAPAKLISVRDAAISPHEASQISRRSDSSDITQITETDNFAIFNKPNTQPMGSDLGAQQTDQLNRRTRLANPGGIQLIGLPNVGIQQESMGSESMGSDSIVQDSNQPSQLNLTPLVGTDSFATQDLTIKQKSPLTINSSFEEIEKSYKEKKAELNNSISNIKFDENHDKSKVEKIKVKLVDLDELYQSQLIFKLGSMLNLPRGQRTQDEINRQFKDRLITDIGSEKDEVELINGFALFLLEKQTLKAQTIVVDEEDIKETLEPELNDQNKPADPTGESLEEKKVHDHLHILFDKLNTLNEAFINPAKKSSITRSMNAELKTIKKNTSQIVAIKDNNKNNGYDRKQLLEQIASVSSKVDSLQTNVDKDKKKSMLSSIGSTISTALGFKDKKSRAQRIRPQIIELGQESIGLGSEVKPSASTPRNDTPEMSIEALENILSKFKIPPDGWEPYVKILDKELGVFVITHTIPDKNNTTTSLPLPEHNITVYKDRVSTSPEGTKEIQEYKAQVMFEAYKANVSNELPIKINFPTDRTNCKPMIEELTRLVDQHNKNLAAPENTISLRQQ